MARFYADEDFPEPVVSRLRDLGHDIVTVRQVGRSGRADQEVLADATADGRAILTHNHRHFKHLHPRNAHAGIVSCSRDSDDLQGLAERIHFAVVAHLDLANRFIRIVRPNLSNKR